MTKIQDDDKMQEATAIAHGVNSLQVIQDIQDHYDDPDDAEPELFTLWVTLTRHLAEGGYPPVELAKEALHHATDEVGGRVHKPTTQG